MPCDHGLCWSHCWSDRPSWLRDRFGNHSRGSKSGTFGGRAFTKWQNHARKSGDDKSIPTLRIRRAVQVSFIDFLWKHADRNPMGHKCSALHEWVSLTSKASKLLKQIFNYLNILIKLTSCHPQRPLSANIFRRQRQAVHESVAKYQRLRHPRRVSMAITAHERHRDSSSNSSCGGHNCSEADPTASPLWSSEFLLGRYYGCCWFRKNDSRISAISSFHEYSGTQRPTVSQRSLGV